MSRSGGRWWIRLGSVVMAAAAVAGGCGTSSDDGAVGVADVAAVSNGADTSAADSAADTTGSALADSTGTTALAPVGAGSPGGTVPEGALDLSTPMEVEGEIEVVLGSDSYLFTARAGQMVSVNLTAMNGVCDDSQNWDLRIDVLKPDGSEMEGLSDYEFASSGCEAYGPWTVPADGDYAVTFTGADQGKGSYTAVLALLALETTPVDLSSPATVSGGIDRVYDSDRFEFEAAAGDQVSVELTALNGGCEDSQEWDLRIDISRTDGRDIDEEPNYEATGSSGCDAYGPWTLPDDGRYLFTFTGDGPEVGTFTAILGRL